MWYWSELDSAPDTPINISKGGMGRLVLEAYLCADAEWVHVHSGSKGGFSRLMALAGLQEQIPPIPTDAASEIGQPIEPWQIELIHETLPVMFAGKTRAEWLKILRDLDIPVMPDLLPGEMAGLVDLIEIPRVGKAIAIGRVLDQIRAVRQHRRLVNPAEAAGRVDLSVEERQVLREIRQVNLGQLLLGFVAVPG